MSLDIELVKSTGEISGSGMFSSVYIMADGRAVKTSDYANADGWLWWAVTAMLSTDNPYTPNIESIHVDVHKNTFVAVMEALAVDCEDLAGAEISDAAMDAGKHLFEMTETICPFPLYRDICGGTANWMLHEDGQEVWTDPFCYVGWRTFRDNPSDRTRVNAFQEYLYSNPVEGITFA